MNDRVRLKTTFDSAAAFYHRARPDYPGALFDELVRAAALGAGDRLAEIGCGTGKATTPLARRGFAITCVERGAELAAEARRNLASYPGVEVVEAEFEAWAPPEAGTFSLVFAATAWHWIDPAVRYAKAWDLLRPGGHLAFWPAQHVFPAGADPFFADIQQVYDEIGEGIDPSTDVVWPTPEQMPDQRQEIEDSGLFSDVLVRRFDWELSYDADGYIRLLDTFSNHIAMEPAKRDRLYGAIRQRLAARPDGILRRHWGAVLHVARRRDRPSPT